MLAIDILGSDDLWDPAKEEFIKVKPCRLKLEHSLISISLWESRWELPYVDTEKTPIMFYDYIRCMSINKDVDPNVYKLLTEDNIKEIIKYINAKKTATTIKEIDNKKNRNNKFITAEYIYYLMTVFNIPFECDKWHFNKLLTLINICSIESQPKKKMKEKDVYNQYREINNRNKKKYHTKG